MTEDDVSYDAWQIVHEAETLPHGAGQIALHEQAISLADQSGNQELAFSLRENALWPLYHGKRPDLLFVHFSWCVAYTDKHPDTPADDLLWTFRWVLDSMPWFPEITLGQIQQSTEDMKRRYEREGCSLRPYWVLKRRNADKMGHLDEAKDANIRYKRCRRDGFCDDPETEDAFDVYHLEYLKQYKAAIARAEPFLNGTYTEAHFQIGISDTLLVPLVRFGRIDEAKKLQKKSARLVSTRPEFLGTADNQIEFLAVIGDLAGAVKCFDQHIDAAYHIPGKFDFFSTLLAVKLMITRLKRKQKQAILLKVPEEMIPGHTERFAPLEAWEAWVTPELERLASLANERNGNTFYSERIAELDELNHLADQIASK
ncbi:MAG: hypothetical protein ACRC8S_18240 [Fimbriiglobus sp.]